MFSLRRFALLCVLCCLTALAFPTLVPVGRLSGLEGSGRIHFAGGVARPVSAKDVLDGLRLSEGDRLTLAPQSVAKISVNGVVVQTLATTSRRTTFTLARIVPGEDQVVQGWVGKAKGMAISRQFPTAIVGPHSGSEIIPGEFLVLVADGASLLSALALLADFPRWTWRDEGYGYHRLTPAGGWKQLKAMDWVAIQFRTTLGTERSLEYRVASDEKSATVRRVYAGAELLDDPLSRQIALVEGLIAERQWLQAALATHKLLEIQPKNQAAIAFLEFCASKNCANPLPDRAKKR